MVLRQVNLGIIGLGSMGTKYAKLLLENNLGFRLTALTRIKPERLSLLETLWIEAPKIYQTNEDLFLALERNEINLDAVLIVTPHYSHPQIVKKALEHNLYVLCDKPVAVSLKEGKELLSYSQNKLGFIFQQRTYPSHQFIKDLIISKKFGEPKRFSYLATNWFRTNSYYQKEAWRASYKTDGGGTILNQCPHNLDFLCDLFSLPTKVTSFNHYGRYHDISVEDESTSYFEWSNLLNGVFTASTGETPGVNRLEIIFSKAKVSLLDDKIEIVENELEASEYNKMNQFDLFIKKQIINIPVLDKSEDAYKAVLTNFYEVITLGKPFIANLSTGLASLYLSNMIYLSGFTGKTIKLAPLGSKEEEKLITEFELELQKKISKGA